MAWEQKRRTLINAGLWDLIAHNLSFALLTVLAILLLFSARAQGSWIDTLRGVAQDIVSPVLDYAAGPSSQIAQWADGLDATLEIYAENQRLRAENAELLAFKNEAITLRQKVTSYERLLKTGTQPTTDFVTGRIIADTGGVLGQTLIVNVGRDAGVQKGHAVASELGLVGHVVVTGKRSARLLLLSDVNSRIPVRLERSSVKAILAGDNSAQPYLDFLPRNTVLVEGDRIVTASDGGIFPPGVPVGTLVQSRGKVRVELFADKRRADFVRVLKYSQPVDVDEALPEPLPGAEPGRKPPPSKPAVPNSPPLIAGPDGSAPSAVAPASTPSSDPTPGPAAVSRGTSPGLPSQSPDRQ
ncbi:MAG TPA: hypothetical protein DCL54_19690 [Alphaproteobacteria bacterium]|nr:hypothetical protein [Alphaproteobacteria bacterium]HAJ48807.1 hypothetical protein [Alphaproteobacteria bacterium]